MKKNAFIKYLINLCTLFLFGVVGVFAMESPEAANMPPDEYLVVDESGIKTFKDVSSYFAWVDSKRLPRIMIVGSGRGGGYHGSREDVRWADKVYGVNAYNYFLVDEDPTFYADAVRDATTNLEELCYDQWDFIITEFSAPFEYSSVGASEVFKLLKSEGKLLEVSPGFGINMLYHHEQMLRSYQCALSQRSSSLENQIAVVVGHWDDSIMKLFMTFDATKRKKLVDRTLYCSELDDDEKRVFDEMAKIATNWFDCAEKEVLECKKIVAFVRQYHWDGSDYTLEVNGDYLSARNVLLSSNAEARSEFLKAFLKLNSDDVQSVKLIEHHLGDTKADIYGDDIRIYLDDLVKVKVKGRNGTPRVLGVRVTTKK